MASSLPTPLGSGGSAHMGAYFARVSPIAIFSGTAAVLSMLRLVCQASTISAITVVSPIGSLCKDHLAFAHYGRKIGTAAQ
jgi:hypothetical protein